MGRESSVLRLVPKSQAAKEAAERARLRDFADRVTDEAHWQAILDSAETPESRAELDRVVGPLLPFRRCANKECESGDAGIWVPVLLFRCYLDGPTTRMTVQRKVCTVCREAITLDDILTDEVWARAIAAYLEADAAWPDRSLTTITFDPVA